jgi:DNA-binding Lrp family transcriptional regulator
MNAPSAIAVLQNCNVIRYSTMNRGSEGLEATMPEGVAIRRTTGADLDAVDRHILSELQADGRMTNVELARRVGLSAPPCLRRVRRLEEQGVIRGYHADLDPHILGWQITFFALVGLETQKEAVLSAFERMVTSWPEVRECHMIRGGGDFMLRLVARDTQHENELTSRLTEAPHVLRVQTMPTIRTAQDLSGVPIARDAMPG